MIEVITAIAGPLISGLIALYVSTVQNDKTVALIKYRLEQLEAKVDQHNHLNERLVKLETKLELLESSKEKE